MSALLEAVSSGVRVLDLAQPMHPGMPSSPNHPGFRMALIRRHGDMVREDGSSAANELIVTGGHVGTHVDALAHVSHRGELHGGISAAKAQEGGRFSRHGIDALAPLVIRGVLLDVAAARDVEVLSGGCGIGVADLEAALEYAAVELGPGDAALVRTGWARHFGDPEAFLGHTTGVPGPTEEGARWLADRGVRLTGSDTTAYEEIPPGQGHRLLPVHRLLLVERGVHIVEMLDLEPLNQAGVHEFCFVLAPLKLIGATGSPVRPLAVVDA
jgi:kynurenine formamidase